MIDITINGANDAAVITGRRRDSVTEASGVANGTPGDATCVRRSGCDRRRQLGDLHRAEQRAKSYGTFSIDATGAWTYTLDDANAAVQALEHVERRTLHDLITVSTADGTEQLIDITINGANDAAVITGDGDGRGDRGERRRQRHAGDADCVRRSGCDRRRQPRRPSGSQTSGCQDGYGTFSIDATGAWTYTLDDNNAAVQALNTASAHAAPTADHGRDGGRHRRRSIDITINGANDAAVITGTATDSVTEASRVAQRDAWDATASGDLDATDVDSSACFTVQTGVAKTYGTFSIDATGRGPTRSTTTTRRCRRSTRRARR